MTARKARKTKGKKFQSAVERTAAEELRSLLRTAKLQRRIKQLTRSIDAAQARLNAALLDYAHLWAKTQGYRLVKDAPALSPAASH